MTPFECIFGLTPLPSRMSFLLSCDVVIILDRNEKVEAMMKIHEKVRLYLEKKNQEVEKRVNKGRRRLVPKLSDWV